MRDIRIRVTKQKVIYYGERVAVFIMAVFLSGFMVYAIWNIVMNTT